MMYGKTLHVVRRRMGRQLSQERPVDADIVIPVPDTGMPAAIGYAEASGIPYGEGLIKNRYVHRTFIQPDDKLRQVGIRMKLNPLTSAIEGKRLVVVDDSIVRGNTTRRIVSMLFDAGAGEVHLRISSPPIQWPCFYGIDMATRAELIAAKKTRGRDPRPHRCHQPALPHARRPAGQHRPAAQPVLPRLLRRRVPHRGARGVRDVQDALREGCGRSDLRVLGPWRGRATTAPLSDPFPSPSLPACLSDRHASLTPARAAPDSSRSQSLFADSVSHRRMHIDTRRGDSATGLTDRRKGRRHDDTERLGDRPEGARRRAHARAGRGPAETRRDPLRLGVRLSRGDAARAAAGARHGRAPLRERRLHGVRSLDLPDTAPIILGEIAAPEGAPTVLLYSHYDVVPAGDESEWHTPPFEPASRDGALYGRGAADTKSNIIAIVGALRAWDGRPPVGVKVVIEGQEEVGGGALSAYPQQHPELFAADVMIIADMGSVRPGVPTLTVALRGMANVTIEVRTLASGKHSGQYGGAAPDALLALIRALSTLHDENGDVAVEGSAARRVARRGPTEEEFRALAEVEAGVPLIGTGDLGVARVVRPGDHGDRRRRAPWTTPSTPCTRTPGRS